MRKNRKVYLNRILIAAIFLGFTSHVYAQNDLAGADEASEISADDPQLDDIEVTADARGQLRVSWEPMDSVYRHVVIVYNIDGYELRSVHVPPGENSISLQGFTDDTEYIVKVYFVHENDDTARSLLGMALYRTISVELLEDPEVGKRQAIHDKIVLLSPFMALAALLLALVSLVLSFLKKGTSAKVSKKTNTESMQSVPTNTENELELVTATTQKLENDTRILKSGVSAIETEICDLKAKVDRLEDGYSREIRELKSLTSSEAAVREATRSGSNDPIDLFNIWAKNPGSRLPSGFSYVREEPKMRASQVLTETTVDTAKWIINKIGEKKYLFPNPNSFDPMTDISRMYAMSVDGLKPKGQNRIQVIKACEMTDSGFINFPGELVLL